MQHGLFAVSAEAKHHAIEGFPALLCDAEKLAGLVARQTSDRMVTVMAVEGIKRNFLAAGRKAEHHAAAALRGPTFHGGAVEIALAVKDEAAMRPRAIRLVLERVKNLV